LGAFRSAPPPLVSKLLRLLYGAAGAWQHAGKGHPWGILGDKSHE